MDDAQHWWRVRATDGKASSAWVVSSFYVNMKNDPPGKPTLKDPADGATGQPRDLEIVSALAQDPDPLDELTYRFQLGTDQQLGTIVEEKKAVQPAKGATEVKWSPTSLQPGGRYWARVRAIDRAGAEGPWSGVVSFRVRGGAAAPDGETPAPDGGGDLKEVEDGRESGGGSQDGGEEPGGGCDCRVDELGVRGVGPTLLLLVLGLVGLRRRKTGLYTKAR